MNDELGRRMKENYEDRYRFYLPRRTYSICRVDGKSFHNYTRNCQKPFDEALMADMDRTAIHLCQNIQGAIFAYTQSDEISLLLTDFETEATDAWFHGNLQKMVSISASMATAAFNAAAQQSSYGKGLALFDSRVFVIPDPT
jgi:tRNA(His) 5'-end guanylyltransferase